jgi:hypothetical protein
MVVENGTKPRWIPVMMAIDVMNAVLFGYCD